MSRRGGTRIGATRKPVVVVAGEDRNDRRILRTVLEEFCPDMRGRIVELAKNVPLRDASARTLGERVRKLARLAKARAEREQAGLACVFVHEDFDRPAGRDYLTTRGRVQEALGREFDTAHYVLAVAETEAWLLLFPTALAKYVTGWSLPRRYLRSDTAKLSDPKKVMINEVSRSGRSYRESDAPVVLAKAVDLGCVHTPSGVNESWTQFHEDINACCGEHLRTSHG